MANPLQPKCIAMLEKEFKAYCINLTAASVAGHMDVIACIDGLFWGFEIKWKNDVPSELQKDKINKCIDAGGRAYFIRSVEDLRRIVSGKIEPIKYKTDKTFIM